VHVDNDEYYSSAYEKVIGTGSVGFVASVYHRLLERGHTRHFELCLELGAGNGQHFPFVKHPFKKYISSDIREVKINLNENGFGQHVSRVLDAENLESINNESVDRIIVTCVLSHLRNPESALIEWRRVLKVGGVLDLYVPCEPGLLLGLAQLLTTRRKVKKLGYDYESIQYREHRNHFPAMRMYLREVFILDKTKVINFPAPVPFWHLRLFDVYRITKLVS
jgi:phosphatidylethanolamine/phosphatidyl-N-methylethanolamine N-methyltransferase